MKSEKELFKLATDMSFIEDKLQENINDFMREELLEEATKIRDILLKKNYDVGMFLYYKDLYKTLSVGEYYEFIKTLE
jgi:hypothetical protein